MVMQTFQTPNSRWSVAYFRWKVNRGHVILATVMNWFCLHFVPSAVGNISVHPRARENLWWWLASFTYIHGRRKDFSRVGPIVDLSRSNQTDFFRMGCKSGKISFYRLESKKTTIFAKHLIGKCQISKSRRALDLEILPLLPSRCPWSRSSLKWNNKD